MWLCPEASRPPLLLHPLHLSQVSPKRCDSRQTHNSFQFAKAAQNVVNSARINRLPPVGQPPVAARVGSYASLVSAVSLDESFRSQTPTKLVRVMTPEPSSATAVGWGHARMKSFASR